MHQTIESNGSSKHLQGTLPREQTTLPLSGNLHRPAGPLGKHFFFLLLIKLNNYFYTKLNILYRVPPHSIQINDGQSPSHLVPGKIRQLGPDLSSTQQTTQKDEWFV